MARMIRILKFFRLLDRNDDLSITNLLVYIFSALVIYLSIVNHNIDLNAVACIIPVLLNYCHKRHCDTQTHIDNQEQYGKAKADIETLTKNYQLQMDNLQKSVVTVAAAVKEVDTKATQASLVQNLGNGARPMQWPGQGPII